VTWLDDEIAQLCTLVQQYGNDNATIAAKLGTKTARQVYDKIKQLPSLHNLQGYSDSFCYSCLFSNYNF
jgi:hypothetical protein